MKYLIALLLSFTPLSAKLIVLIIASDDLPIYQELQNVWRSYMHFDPEQIKAYFIKGDPNLPTPYLIEGDTIWAQTQEEGGIPALHNPSCSGILNKTLLAFEAILQNHPFDYILRTNLSSFFIFPKLLEFLQTAPQTNYYSYGSPVRLTFGSGAGFILSPDLVKLLVTHKHHLLNDTSAPDDVVISKFLAAHHMYPKQFYRVDLTTLQDLPKQLKLAPRKHLFHFRIKHPDNSQRILHEIPVHRELIKQYYPDTI